MIRHFHQKTLLALLFGLITFPGLSWALPQVTGIDGIAADGQTITIRGSDFGADGPNVVLFDDFENGNNGSPIAITPGSAAYGNWDRLGSAGVQTYSNDYAVSGSNAFRVVNRAGYDMGRCEISKFFNPSKHIFVSFWTYIRSSDVWPGYGHPSGTNWKMSWLHSGAVGSNCIDTDLVVATIAGDRETDSRGGSVIGNCSNDGDGATVARLGTASQKGRWMRRSAYIIADRTDGAALTQILDINYDGSNTMTELVSYEGNVGLDAPSESYAQFDLNAYQRGNVGSNETRTYFDDVYVATGNSARARIEIGDRQDYESCTKMGICIPTQWSNTGINAIVKEGMFNSGETAYIFVVDADGNYSPGYPITIGDGANPVVPVPRNVVVVGSSN